MSTKSEERVDAKRKLESLSTEFVKSASSVIADKLFNTSFFQKSDIVFVYLSFQKEVDTTEIIANCLKLGKKVAIPRIINDKMLAIDIESVSNFEYNRYGIKEPTDGISITPDLVIMPLLAFDSNGFRLGRGGGYYDRYLDEVKAKGIALAFSVQMVDRLPVDSFDIKPDVIITEEEIFYESSRRKAQR